MNRWVLDRGGGKVGRWFAVLLLSGYCVHGATEGSASQGKPGIGAPEMRGHVLRRAEECYEATRSAPPAPLALPLDSGWTPSAATTVTCTEEGLRVSAESQIPVLNRAVAIRAEQYNELRLVMKTDRGLAARFSWKSDLEPRLGIDPSIAVPIVADNQFHTYVFPLDFLHTERWAGSVDQLTLLPANQPGTTVIASCQFGFDPSVGPRRVTIDNCTHQALFGTQSAWEFVVPPDATFEVSLGVLERAWKECNSDGVRFKVTLDAASKKDEVLLDEVVKPPAAGTCQPWKSLQASLSAFAGEKASIRMSVDPLGTTTGDYAYWGDPLVFSRAEDKTSIPVVLISCDTFRADHLSCYGYRRKTTPHLDAWAEEAVVFETAIVQEVWTPTSHMTMLTGLYPKNHGMTSNSNLPEEVLTLPEALAREGYLTAGFTGHSWWLLPWRGFAHGFDVYNTPESFRDVFETQQKVIEWLQRHPAPRRFLFFHNYDLHTKFDTKHFAKTYDTGHPEYTVFLNELAANTSLDSVREMSVLSPETNKWEPSISALEADFLKACYDDCVRYVDQALFELFAELKGQGLYDRALIIVTADHGEEFGDHKRYQHLQVYDECCRVPLMIKFPGGRFGGRRVKSLVQLTDLYPTVLDVLGIPWGPTIDGKSLLPLVEGTKQSPPFAYTQRTSFQAVRTENMKLLRNINLGTYELYDLSKDPGERENILDKDPVAGAKIRAVLERFFQPEPDGWHIRFRYDGTHWQGKIKVVTDGRFDKVRLVRSDRDDGQEIRSDPHVVQGTITLFRRVRDEELILKPASAQARLYVSIESESPFGIYNGSTVQDPTKACQIVLDPADPSCSVQPDPKRSLQEGPILTTWYEKGRTGQTAAKDLPPEGIEALRALGYGE